MERNEIIGIIAFLGYVWFVAIMFFIFGNSSPVQDMSITDWKDPLTYVVMIILFFKCNDSWPFYVALLLTNVIMATIAIKPIRLKMWERPMKSNLKKKEKNT